MLLNSLNVLRCFCYVSFSFYKSYCSLSSNSLAYFTFSSRSSSNRLTTLTIFFGGLLRYSNTSLSSFILKYFSLSSRVCKRTFSMASYCYSVFCSRSLIFSLATSSCSLIFSWVSYSNNCCLFYLSSSLACYFY